MPPMNELCRPKLFVSRVWEIDFAKLAELGIVNICCDIDNTLAERKAMEPMPEALQAINDARSQGYIKKFCIVSNIIVGEHRRRRVQGFAKALNTDFWYAAGFWDRKPKPAPFVAGMKMMGSAPQTTAMIGDQLFTDILGANRLGMYSILVEPIGGDHWTTRLSGRRRREKEMLKLFGLK